MNLVRGGHFAPSLELKPFFSIETHPPTLLCLSLLFVLFVVSLVLVVVCWVLFFGC